MLKTLEKPQETEIETKQVDVLGVSYTVEICPHTKHAEFRHSNGFCDPSIRLIAVKEDHFENMPLRKKQEVMKKVIRHELLHAFLFESGLAGNSDWATDEEMIDWFALQFPKLVKAFEQVECL